jgi:hypothetical protein
MTEGRFVAQGYVMEAKTVATFDKEAGVTKKIVLKVEIPEPGDERGKEAFRQTAKDLADCIGERSTIQGETLQVLLPSVRS